MNHNNIPEQLENKHKDVQMSSNTDTGVSVDVTADTGASVNAPVLTGNIITGPVNINLILNPAVHNTPTRINEGSTAEDSKVDIHHYGKKISLRLKNILQEDYNRILVGNSQTDHRGHLKDISNLYVVEKETGRTVSDHDVIEIESTNRFTANDTPIQCNDIFKDHMGRQNRKVLTIGIAGVGKTVSVNKFILDWAEGKENQDILFVFPLPFRRLNLIKKKHSLMELLNKCFFRCPEGLPSLSQGDGKVMFIFDGLDECRFPLEFKKGDRFTDVHKKTTVSKIVTNLIETHLVPSALIWITSRPSAAGLIPRYYIDQVTEVRGFNDEQKEQYFNKNCPEVAGNIISHIRKSRSLYIMCHIPVFCWISLTVLEPLLAKESNDKTPTTLTEMYTSFLLCQQQQMKTKYHDGPEPKPKAKSFDQILLKLGKLAFKQLEKDNLIFYKKDLEKCGLDVSEGSVYSGFFTRIFQAEKAVSERKIYSFIHLSIQEFLAALYVFFKYKYYGRNAFLQSERRKLTLKVFKTSLFDLHKSAVNKSLKSENGHLDLFLRFLLGLSLESNQSDLKELLPMLDLKSENVKDTADYIRQKIEKEKSVERTINLFHCLSELKDDIQNNLNSGNLSAQNLSSAQWSAQEFVRQTSEETQEKFELPKYRRSDEALRLPANQNSRRALVDHGGEIRMTAGPRKFAYNLTLDPNTSNTRLILYEENRKVKHVKARQLYPDHSERFADVPQVLCGESLTGRCYWEVECSGWVNISVSYKEISRKGGREDCKFGSNDKSWSLFCTDNRFTVCHNNDSTDLLAPSPRSDRVGVYVDVSAGTLSFYSVSDTHTLTHLHTFNTTFTEPLYAGFRVDYASSVSLFQIKTETHT